MAKQNVTVVGEGTALIRNLGGARTIDRFLSWIRRSKRSVMCKHDWEAVGDAMLPYYVGEFKCRKCGKREGL